VNFAEVQTFPDAESYQTLTLSPSTVRIKLCEAKSVAGKASELEFEKVIFPTSNEFKVLIFYL
tara:strand:- start:225 stop:413 length:189 start_codon:yes stop_codon:yes gene_type:complete